MNRIKKIIEAFRDLGQDPVHSISAAWSNVMQAAQRGRSGEREDRTSEDILVIDRIVSAIVSLADKAAAKTTETN